MWKLRLAIFSLTLATKINRVITDWADSVMAEVRASRGLNGDTKCHSPAITPVEPNKVDNSDKAVYCAVCSHDWRMPSVSYLPDEECPRCGAQAVSNGAF